MSIRYYTSTLLLAGVAALGAQGSRPEVRFLERRATLAPAGPLRIAPPLEANLGAPYPGAPLDSVSFTFFAIAYPAARELDDSSGLAVLYQLPMGSERTGFVLRVPSQYEATAAVLWIFNRRTDAWEAPIPLADAFGDGCWHFRREAWIVDLDGDGMRDIVQRERSTWIDDRTGIPGQSDSLFVARGGPSGQAPYERRSDTGLLARFDVSPWTALRRGDCE